MLASITGFPAFKKFLPDMDSCCDGSKNLPLNDVFGADMSVTKPGFGYFPSNNSSAICSVLPSTGTM
uniref:Uncharacterized protein n=1 Tax=Acrobeloides nanus TaxID=290746 RepID=A0A914EN05_9BILA